MKNLLYLNDRKGEYPNSLYADTRIDIAPFPTLRGDIRTDVAVIGGGYTGLSAALHLARKGFQVTLLEAHRVGFGASGRNGGQLGSGQRQEVDWLESKFGREQARRLWDLAEDAKALVKSLAAEAVIPIRDGIAHACRKQAEVKEAHEMAEHLAKYYNYDKIEPLDKDGLAELLGSQTYVGGDVDWGAGHLHPLNFALGLALLASEAGAQILEDSLVTHIDHAANATAKSTVHCERGKVICDHVILAGNGYLGNIDRNIAARVMPINNYIIATQPLGDEFAEILPKQTAAADTKFVVNYWRVDDQRQLIFGGGESATYRFPKNFFKTVRQNMLSVYPQLEKVLLTYAWGGTLAITMNRMPYFARPAPNCLSASGFSGHGVAMATLSGQLMAKAVAGQAEEFDTMASIPTPAFPGGDTLRGALLVAGMAWYGLRDRLG